MIRSLPKRLFKYTKAAFRIAELEENRLLENCGFVAHRTAMQEIKRLLADLRPISVENAPLIRLGPKGDGGYLVPDDLNRISACFSPGVSDNSGFEFDCAQRGMEVFLADASVSKPATQHPNFHFLPKYIKSYHASDSITLASWVEQSQIDERSDLLLQMDIESFEYETVLSTPESLLKRFRILIIEFHELDCLWDQMFFKIARSVFDKILTNHACVHIHPNNFVGSHSRDGIVIPRLCEFTFHRRDRIRMSHSHSSFPHPLDCDNTANPPLGLDKCWYEPSTLIPIDFASEYPK